MNQRGKHINYYKTRIDKKLPIPRTFLESGLLVELYYRPEDEKVAKYYYILILHPGYGPFPHKLLHALTLEHLNPMYFNKFVDDIGLEYSAYMKKIRRVAIEKLIIDKKDSKRFYLSELKRRLDTSFENTYRTFNVANIKGIRIIDFKFANETKILNDSMQKQLNDSDNSAKPDKEQVISKYIRPQNQ